MRKSFRNRKVYVSIYAIHRCYGGPEEGGWWYDWWEHKRTYPRRVRGCRVDAVKAKMLKRHGWNNPRGRYSVVGGADCVVQVEDHAGESATRHTPHYE